MTPASQKTTPFAVILGSSGNLGRLIRPFWAEPSSRWLTRQDLGGDLLNAQNTLCSQLKGARAVLCLAGVTPGSQQPMSLNVDLARATLDAAQTAQAGRVFLCSSAAVYGHAQAPLSEVHPGAPVSDYGRAKQQMEQMAQAHPHPTTCLRIGNVAGADAILGGWRKGMMLDQLADGRTPQRSYIGPETLARVLAHLMTQPDLPALMNLCAPGAIEMGALLKAAQRPFDLRPATEKTIARVELDTKLLECFYSFDQNDSAATTMITQWGQTTQ